MEGRIFPFTDGFEVFVKGMYNSNTNENPKLKGKAKVTV